MILDAARLSLANLFAPETRRTFQKTRRVYSPQRRGGSS